MCSSVQAIRGAGTAIGTFALLLAIVPTTVSAQATIFAEGLVNPSGIYVDDNGYLWVASLGTGSNNAGVYIVSPTGAVNPFITGLPSSIVMGEPGGTNHVYINNDTELIVVQGAGGGALSGTIFTVDTTGFTPGDAPLGPANVNEVFPISTYVKGELGGDSNPYALTFVPNSDVAYLSDAAANAIVQGNDGGLSIHAQFPNIRNSGSVGPLTVNVVPTGLEYYDGTIYVGTLTGFPFNEGAASILAVDTLGNVSTYLSGLTTVVDLQVIPGGSGVIFLEHRFDANAGKLYKYENEQLTEVASGLDRPVGLRIGPSGEVYVSLLTKGQIVKIDGVVTDVDDEIPSQVQATHAQAYPNPFADVLNLNFDVATAGSASLTIVDVLGRSVYQRDLGRLSAGEQRLQWDGGASVSPGTYLYQLTIEGSTVTGVIVKQ